MPYTVVRVLEYTYPTAARAMEQIARWAIPATGERVFGDETIRSHLVEDPQSVAEQQLREALAHCERLGLHPYTVVQAHDALTINGQTRSPLSQDALRIHNPTIPGSPRP